MNALINIHLVVTNKQGKVVHHEKIAKPQETSLEEFAQIVAKRQQELEKQYKRETYDISIGAADSLSSLIQSFPDIIAPKTGKKAILNNKECGANLVKAK
jgi:hypothetical protein